MNNHLNILLKHAKFDLKSSEMHWWLGWTPLWELTTLPQTS